MFFLGGGKYPNLGVVNVRILGVVNVRLANNLTPIKNIDQNGVGQGGDGDVDDEKDDDDDDDGDEPIF